MCVHICVWQSKGVITLCVFTRIWKSKGVTTLGVCACVWRSKGVTTLGVYACVWPPKDTLECCFSEAVHLVFCDFTGLKVKDTKLAGRAGQGVPDDLPVFLLPCAAVTCGLYSLLLGTQAQDIMLTRQALSQASQPKPQNQL